MLAFVQQYLLLLGHVEPDVLDVVMHVTVRGEHPVVRLIVTLGEGKGEGEGEGEGCARHCTREPSSLVVTLGEGHEEGQGQGQGWS